MSPNQSLQLLGGKRMANNHPRLPQKVSKESQEMVSRQGKVFHKGLGSGFGYLPEFARIFLDHHREIILDLLSAHLP